MQRGEIRWYKFKAPDKQRPVLILTRNSILDVLGEITVAPVTSTIRSIPTEIFLGLDDGMKQDCVINVDHLQTVSKSKLGALITTVSSSKMEQVRDAVLFALGF